MKTLARDATEMNVPRFHMSKNDIMLHIRGDMDYVFDGREQIISSPWPFCLTVNSCGNLVAQPPRCLSQRVVDRPDSTKAIEYTLHDDQDADTFLHGCACRWRVPKRLRIIAVKVHDTCCLELCSLRPRAWDFRSFHLSADDAAKVFNSSRPLGYAVNLHLCAEEDSQMSLLLSGGGQLHVYTYGSANVHVVNHHTPCVLFSNDNVPLLGCMVLGNSRLYYEGIAGRVSGRSAQRAQVELNVDGARNFDAYLGCEDTSRFALCVSQAEANPTPGVNQVNCVALGVANVVIDAPPQMQVVVKKSPLASVRRLPLASPQ